MPLTAKGQKILRSMQQQYGSKKGEQVFYASRNAGKIAGVEGGRHHQRKNFKHFAGEGRR